MNIHFIDIPTQTLVLRVVNAFFILIVAILLYACARVVANVRLTKIFWKASLFAGLYFLLRILAGIADSIFASEIGYFSNLVNMALWGQIINKVWKLFRVLSSPKNDEMRSALREDIDELIVTSDELVSRIGNARLSAKTLIR